MKENDGLKTATNGYQPKQKAPVGKKDGGSTAGYNPQKIVDTGGKPPKKP